MFTILSVVDAQVRDERAAARAFLLPAIARDAVTTVLRSLLDAEPSVAHLLLAIATVAVLGLPLVAFVVV
jgi:hypothetical protein